jgi:phage-related protein
MKTSINYYVSPSGKKVVQQFISSLNKNQQAKVLRIINTIKVYCLLSVIPHLKKISGTPLWEIRILGKDNIRIFYVALSQISIVVLHGFIKKKQKNRHKRNLYRIESFERYKQNVYLTMISSMISFYI